MCSCFVCVHARVRVLLYIFTTLECREPGLWAPNLNIIEIHLSQKHSRKHRKFSWKISHPQPPPLKIDFLLNYKIIKNKFRLINNEIITNGPLPFSLLEAGGGNNFKMIICQRFGKWKSCSLFGGGRKRGFPEEIRDFRAGWAVPFKGPWIF